MNKPTVGEVREFGCGDRARVRVRFAGGVSGFWPGVAVVVGRWCPNGCDGSRIVEVAPKNRAHVTAGPPWMGAQ